MRGKPLRVKRKQFWTVLFCLAVYLFTVLWFTVLKRTFRFDAPRFEFLWSYRKWVAGDLRLGIQILENMAMFMPLGFLLSALFDCDGFGSAEHRCLKIIVLSAAYSFFIEILQLETMKGLFELDDLLSNSVGAIAGICFYNLLKKLQVLLFNLLKMPVLFLVKMLFWLLMLLLPSFMRTVNMK